MVGGRPWCFIAVADETARRPVAMLRAAKRALAVARTRGAGALYASVEGSDPDPGRTRGWLWHLGFRPTAGACREPWMEAVEAASGGSIWVAEGEH
jgi:hypothetical protein